MPLVEEYRATGVAVISIIMAVMTRSDDVSASRRSIIVARGCAYSTHNLQSGVCDYALVRIGNKNRHNLENMRV